MNPRIDHSSSCYFSRKAKRPETTLLVTPELSLLWFIPILISFLTAQIATLLAMIYWPLLVYLTQSNVVINFATVIEDAPTLPSVLRAVVVSSNQSTDLDPVGPDMIRLPSCAEWFPLGRVTLILEVFRIF